MQDYITHYEIRGDLRVLIIREFITSNFSVYKTLYFINTEMENRKINFRRYLVR